MSAPEKLALRRRTLRSVADLVAAGLAPLEAAAALGRVAERYAVAVPPEIADAIAPGDPADPLARQFLPAPVELETAPEERADPIGDEPFTPIKGIVHRHPDRVLLKPLLVCPVYCRFCFRREQVGQDGGALTATEMAAALDYIRARPEIWEVILTGGEPMLLPPARLGRLVAELAAIPQVEVIRLHTRLPVADPGRVTAATVAALRHDKPVYAVLHCNHPRELSEAVRGACRRLVDGGIPMLGQTVLLRGVNDDAATLEALMRALVRQRIKPYYLHHPDLAPGTAHFRLSIAEGQALVRELRRRVSGLCQPTYVLDIPGGHGKVPLNPSHVREGGVEDADGLLHPYPGDLTPP